MRRFPLMPAIMHSAPRAHRVDNPVRRGIGVTEAAADRAAVAHCAISDVGRQRALAYPGHGQAAGRPRYSPLSRRRQSSRVSSSSSIRVNSGMPVMSISMRGCASRRFSIGPSDCAAGHQRAAPFASASEPRGLGYTCRAHEIERRRLHACRPLSCETLRAPVDRGEDAFSA